jgi:hypothetical protein
MNAFEIETADLILCSNLLLADAREWEKMSAKPENAKIIEERAKYRRDLAAKLISEVNARQKEFFDHCK